MCKVLGCLPLIDASSRHLFLLFFVNQMDCKALSSPDAIYVTICDQ